MNRKRCYVITPYDKKDIGGGKVVDFEDVYRNIVCKSVELDESPQLMVQRSKDETKGGIITEGFINGIFKSEIAIIDVSGNNPNVYYELGLRHAFRKGANVLIGYVGTELPFDIAGIKVIWYDPTTEESRKESIHRIASHLREALIGNQGDSPVYKFIPDLRVEIPAKRCRALPPIEYLVQGTDDKRLGIRTGAITEIHDVDVWVNSENTSMEMARIWDRSISSLIRYHGSKRDTTGNVKEDTIQNHLRKKVGPGKTVAAATVIPTPAGGLRKFGVKTIFHIASVEGTPGFGFRPIREAHLCVTRGLEKLQELNSKKRAPDLLSILFPIFGTGQGGHDPSVVLAELVQAAYDFVKNHPTAAANRIYFLAYTEEQLASCRDVFAQFKGLKEVAS
jgi:O-acetyl-ADP-ribose deacetylase (regulator of RNase III)